MRILITGGEGQVGRALRKALAGHDLISADLETNEPETVALDITRRSAVYQALAEHEPELVINSAAYTDVDGCARNPALAYRVNGLGTQNLALACQATGARMVHLSTNEVFAGDNPSGYEEWMPLNPINAYGRSKAAGETFVREVMRRFYIVRLSWLFAPGGRNFIHAILERARRDGRLQVVADEIGCPTYDRDLAEAIAQLITTESYGTYHFTNAGACSRWAFANEILRQAGFEEVVNTPILSRRFQRASSPPPFGVLHNIAGAAIGITLRPWQDALAEYLKETSSE